MTALSVPPADVTGGSPTAATRRPRRERHLPSVAAPRRRTGRVLVAAALVLIGLTFLVPLAWIVLASLDPAATVSVKVPESLTLDNFTQILTWETTFRPLWNSTLISGGTAVLTVLASVLAAYPLSRYQMRFRKPFLYTILFGTCLPITAMMVPVYALFVYLGMLDSVPGTIFFLAATSLPMAIWMTKNFMDSVPVSLEEAAWVDGAGSMTALMRVVVPLMRPGIAVVFIFVFTQAWGNFFVPFVLLFSPDNQPAAVAIYSFFGTYGTVAYGRLAAFSILYSVPVLVLYLLVQRFSGGSFAMSGAVKG
ncbi:carbohydrate ABC transporter permease [Cellulomonas triticagri]|uniref:Carbohydrate ABC transporter permease n=1 Tax=Cellulomonas triticagri TaxID=2483352 RepID=A0A3M2J858_9CELL|nr:carbohydrate ABC transporter permease [Cellulomonas triticagri]RMI09609.1 carbohydrate ABC transporter permease [Cellulomonas triticagri]